MAPYSSGAWRQHCSRPLQLEPFMPRVGRFTSSPCQPFGPASTARREEISREKSQSATSSPSGAVPRVIRGRSILPLKWPATGRPPAAPMRMSPAIPARGPSTRPLAVPVSSTRAKGRSACCPTETAPVSGSMLAHTRYQARESIGLPTATVSTPPAVATRTLAPCPPSRTSASPPDPPSHDRMPCPSWSGSVGQIVADTVRASASSLAPGMRA